MKEERESQASAPVESTEFSGTLPSQKDYTDGRRRGDWKTRYPDCRKEINREAACLVCSLLLFLTLTSVSLSLSGEQLRWPLNMAAIIEVKDAVNMPSQTGGMIVIDFTLLSTFFLGCLGGTTFSMKWLVHSVAKGTWNIDRRYWRFFVPLVGGVYSCVVLTLINGGLIGASHPDTNKSVVTVAGLSFLVGYFSDGVSGLLSNVANAVFGTLEKK